MRRFATAVILAAMAAERCAAQDIVIETPAPLPDGSGGGLSLHVQAVQWVEVPDFMLLERVSLWLASDVPTGPLIIRVSQSGHWTCDDYPVPDDTIVGLFDNFVIPPLGPEPRLITIELNGGGPFLMRGYSYLRLSTLAPSELGIRWCYSTSGLTLNGPYGHPFCLWDVGLNTPLGMRLEGQRRVSRCRADWDGSGGIDGDDIVAFFDDWEAGRADFDRSGGTDGFDITRFFESWQRGC